MGTQLEAVVRDTEGLAQALGAIIDQLEKRQGRLPSRITLPASAVVAEALRRIFTTRTVHPAGDGQIRLELRTFLRDQGPSAEGALVEALYAALNRAPTNPVAAGRALRAAIELHLVSIDASTRAPAARAFVRAQRASLGNAQSPIVDHAVEQGEAAATRLVTDIVRCLDAVADLREPLRAPTFAARFLGNSKVLRPGGTLHRWVGEALVAHDPRTLDLLDELGVFPGPAAHRANALEAHGVLFDEAAASVLCFGPLVYRKDRQAFDQIARHASLGESSRLIAQQLREATLDRPVARCITIFENLAPYLEYVDACIARGRQDDIVVCAAGQANLAVVGLLRLLAPHALPARYVGDLDRSGILILRSLARRSGLPLAPRFMDVETHRRFADRGLPLGEEERARIGAMLRRDSDAALGHALLREIVGSGRWIEQEAFAEEALADLLED